MSESKVVNIKGAHIIIGKASGHKEMCYSLLGVLYDGTELYHLLILKSWVSM
jgi:hypothetical protein